MLKAFKKLWNDKRGNALIIAGAALPLLVGSAGLATDTIQWTLWKRQLQRAADSAALAGVYDRVSHDNSTGNVLNAVNNDLGRHNHTNITLLSGYPQVDYPSGTNWTNPVRVTLALQKQLGFSSLFLSSPPTISARATGATVATGVYCVVSLVDTSATGIRATGNGDLNLGCGMITNSTSLTAAIATGSSEVDATPVAAVGDIQDSDNWGGAELLPFTVKQTDPYADVNVPPFSPCKGGANKIQVNPGVTVDRSADTGVQCVSDISANGTLKLGSATYIIDGGNFSAGAQAKVSCTNCTIVLTNSDGGTPTIGQVDMNGGAEMIMSAPEGGTFDGILFYQDRRAPESTTIVHKVNGNSNSLMEGAFYFPTQQLQINGTAGLDFECAQFVSYVVEFAGNGSINNTCPGGYGDGEIMGRHVRLVA